jgi:hypothetical protein
VDEYSFQDSELRRGKPGNRELGGEAPVPTKPMAPELFEGAIGIEGA